MRLMVKWRSLTAASMVLAGGVNLLGLGQQGQLPFIFNIQNWFAPLAVRQIHSGVTMLLVVGMSVLSVVLWRLPFYSRKLAHVVLFCAVLSAILAFCFSVPFASVWLLVCYAAWRLSGGVGKAHTSRSTR